MQSHKYDVPVLLDTASSVALEYSVSAIPTTIFINRDGIIQYIGRGAFQTQNELQNALNKIK